MDQLEGVTIFLRLIWE